MDVLGKAFFGDVETCLHRLSDMHPRRRADEIAFVGIFLGLDREGILVRIDQAPHILG